MENINVIWSETWLGDYDYSSMEEILNSTIKEYVSDDEEIINIECKEESSGLSRFWIYTRRRT